MSPYSILGSNFLSCTRKRHVKHTELDANYMLYLLYVLTKTTSHSRFRYYIYLQSATGYCYYGTFIQAKWRTRWVSPYLMRAVPSRRYCFVITIMLHTTSPR